MDHGILNVPLSKRGNIDVEIDKYKRGQAAIDREQRRAAATEARLIRERASWLITQMSHDDWSRIAHGNGMTVSYLAKKLKSEAYWNPNRVIRLLQFMDAESQKS